MKSKSLGGIVAALVLVFSLVVTLPVGAQSGQPCSTLFAMLDTHVAVIFSLQQQLNDAVAKLNADADACSSQGGGGLPGSGCSDLLVSDMQMVADLQYRIQNEQQLISQIQSSIGIQHCSR